MSWFSSKLKQKPEEAVGQVDAKRFLAHFSSLERTVDELKAQNRELTQHNNTLQTQLSEARRQPDGSDGSSSEDDIVRGALELTKVLQLLQGPLGEVNSEVDQAAIDVFRGMSEDLNKEISRVAETVDGQSGEKLADKGRVETARNYVRAEMGNEFLQFLDLGTGGRESLVLRIGTQALLTHRCAQIINMWDYSNKARDRSFRTMFLGFAKKASPITAGRWKATVKPYILDTRRELDKHGRPTKLIDHVYYNILCVMFAMGYPLSDTDCAVQFAKLEDGLARCVELSLSLEKLASTFFQAHLIMHWPENGNKLESYWVEELNKHMNIVRGNENAKMLCSASMGFGYWQFFPESRYTVITKARGFSHSILEDLAAEREKAKEIYVMDDLSNEDMVSNNPVAEVKKPSKAIPVADD